MSTKVRRWFVAGSALFALAGAIVAVVYFFQPWRRCDYEDTSVGCAMLPADASVMGVAMVVTALAAGVLVFAVLAKGRLAAR